MSLQTKNPSEHNVQKSTMMYSIQKWWSVFSCPNMYCIYNINKMLHMNVSIPRENKNRKCFFIKKITLLQGKMLCHVQLENNSSFEITSGLVGNYQLKNLGGILQTLDVLKSNLIVEFTFVPTALMSGFKRPSCAGPLLEELFLTSR